MGLEHLYGRIVTATLGALLGVCALLAGTKFIRSRAKLLSLLVRAHGALFAVMMGAVAGTLIIVASVKPENAPTNMVGRAAPSAPQGQVNGAPLRRPGGWPPYRLDGPEVEVRRPVGWPPYRPVGSRVPRDRNAEAISGLITHEDVSNGYCVAETREGREIVGRDAFGAPQIHVPWLLRGGYEDTVRIVPYGWSFPWRDGILDEITVFSRGELRPNIRTRYFPQPFNAPLAVVPSFNWGLLPGGVSNVFWHAVSPSNSLVVTWENSPVNRDVNTITNFQAELFADGRFEYRYDDRTVGYSRVHPLDLDFDGLPNMIDPEPETPLGAPVWNQSDAWAAAAFLNHAAEIMSAGGYLAWATQRASDPNRRLVWLNVALQGGRWPVCVDVGIVPVMADGSSDLLYAIDCGAQVPFSLSDGELESVEVRRRGDAPPYQTVGARVPRDRNAFPCEVIVGDVTVHLDSPRTGWLRRIAEVNVEAPNLTHLRPGESAHLTAVVTNCHADAYLGCAWHGGEGISFSNPHSLATTFTYASSSTVQWATNNAYLVTSYAGGYSLTNTIWFTVGIEEEPTPCFTLGCQKVFFLNDADFLNDGPCPTNRPERIRPVTLNLLGPYGTNGTVKLSAQGSASPVMFYIDNGATNLMTETTEIPLEVTDSFARTGTNTFYVSCPQKGTGTISATLTLDGGATLTDTASFKCIEPLRKLVTTEKIDGRFINPSRLVMGTNAVLQVGVNGDFDATNVHWHVVSGSADISPTNGFTTTVVPTGANEDVVIEACFNDDEVQPQFILPVVEPRTIPLRVFVVEPPSHLRNNAWTDSKISEQITSANEIYSQVGIHFELVGEPQSAGTSADWSLQMVDVYTNQYGETSRGTTVSIQATALFNEDSRTNGCIYAYFVGEITEGDAVAFRDKNNVAIGKEAPTITLAHEIGHVLGLEDIYHVKYGRHNGIMGLYSLAIRNNPVSPEVFVPGTGDWMQETGRGFYRREDTVAVIMEQLLMYGVEKKSSLRDIPDREMFGLTGRKDIRKTFVEVGVSCSKGVRSYD